MSGETLIVTQVGLDDATNVALHGISVVLNTFKVGSAYGYTPTLSDTALHGSVLYSGGISSYSRDSQGNLILSLNMDPSAGPFQFGELGVYRDDGTLFALMSFPDLQNKYSSLGNNVASAFNFTCYLRLGQAGALIDVSAGGGGGPAFSYVLEPGQPPALWGTTDSGVTSQCWDPSNFNVSTAKHIDNTGASSHLYANDFTWKTASAGTTLATLNGSGTFTAVVVGQSSDIRMKENIEDLNDYEAMMTVLDMHGIGYNFIADQNKKRRLGFSAQEIQRLAPALVDTYMDEASGEERLALVDNGFSPLFAGALRYLFRKMEQLENQ